MAKPVPGEKAADDQIEELIKALESCPPLRNASYTLIKRLTRVLKHLSVDADDELNTKTMQRFGGHLGAQRRKRTWPELRRK